MMVLGFLASLFHLHRLVMLRLAGRTVNRPVYET